ncbi:MAG: YjgP/YjgQ family permease [Planctomycetota bacterium]|jgi:lipopolysaccharide export system permease protein|nr:MAG: YjgP/YjgQ family permease [Planctomycetota bacterium]
MKIISRYVLSELLQVFLVALTALTLFMLVIGLVKEAQQQGLGFLQIAALVPYVLPEAMRFAVPGTMLFAVASVFGRMSASNEITALKAAGITPMATIWPAMALAVVVSFVSVWLNDVAVSWGRDGVRRVIVGSVEEIIYGRLRQQRSYSTPQVSINVKGVDGKKLIRPTLSFQPGGSAAPVTVSAAEAQLRADAAAGTLVITFRDGTLHVGDFKAVFPDTIERVVPLNTVSQKNIVSTSPSEIAMADFTKARTEQIARISQLEQESAAKTAMAILSGRMEQSVPGAVEFERQAVKQEQSRLKRIIMEPWRRWANGFSCLCFVLVGAPMAIRMRNADFLTSFFLCFLPILIIYYPVFMLGISRVKAGALPPSAVWMGNVLMMLWGLWLLRRVVRN